LFAATVLTLPHTAREEIDGKACARWPSLATKRQLNGNDWRFYRSAADMETVGRVFESPRARFIIFPLQSYFMIGTRQDLCFDRCELSRTKTQQNESYLSSIRQITLTTIPPRA
jgi:hypothetical protein